MGRRQQDQFFDELVDLLKMMPVWVGPALAAVAWLAIRYVVPFLLPKADGPIDFGTIIRGMLPIFSWCALAIILFAWGFAEIAKFIDRWQLNRLGGSGTANRLSRIKHEYSWSEFERLVAEAYRRKGYTAEVVGSSSGDGGVDIRLTRNGQLILVQCKQWRKMRVRLPVVRELLGAITSFNADGGILVTSGNFTREAERFAEANNIELVNGPALARLIGSVLDARREEQKTNVNVAQKRPAASTDQQKDAAPVCPKCGAAMVLRTARQGKHVGNQFWGCSAYPNCREIIRYEANAASRSA